MSRLITVFKAEAAGRFKTALDIRAPRAGLPGVGKARSSALSQPACSEEVIFLVVVEVPAETYKRKDRFHTETSTDTQTLYLRSSSKNPKDLPEVSLCRLGAAVM